jgi:hypothetical protein
MTPQQDQWIRLIEDRLEKLEDTCLRPEELRQCERLAGDIEVLKTLLKERVE